MTALLICCLSPRFKPAETNVEKRSPSFFSRLFASRTPKSGETPLIKKKEHFEFDNDESDYESGDDDDAFDLPSDDADLAVERTYSLRKHHLINRPEQYSKKTFQAMPDPWKVPQSGGAEFSDDLLLPERSPPNSTRSRALKRSSGCGKNGRTQSTLSFDEELELFEQDQEVEFQSDSESEDLAPRSQKRMLISFKEEREKVVVWNTVSIESLPNTYVFNVGDVVYLEDGAVVGTIMEMLDDGKHYRVEIRDSKCLREVSHTELEHCIKIIVKHPSAEQNEFFETCENEPNKNLLSTACSSFACARPKKGNNLHVPPT